jgi:hypothetical protein
MSAGGAAIRNQLHMASRREALRVEEQVVSEWIACKDRMPERYTGVLVTDGKFVTAAEWTPIRLGPNDPRGEYLPSWSGHEFSGHEWEWDFDERDITHWMPLPTPPSVGAP